MNNKYHLSITRQASGGRKTITKPSSSPPESVDLFSTLWNMKLLGRSRFSLSQLVTCCCLLAKLLVIICTGKFSAFFNMTDWLFDGRVSGQLMRQLLGFKTFKRFTRVSKIERICSHTFSETVFKLFKKQMFVKVSMKITRYSVDSPSATIIFAFVLSVRNQTDGWPPFNPRRLNKLILCSHTRKV